jgi:hypothetical protein
METAASYFTLVFGTGFVLGTIRVLWVVPQLGLRNAELLEQPIMLVALFLSARWIVRTHRWPNFAMILRVSTPASLAWLPECRRS